MQENFTVAINIDAGHNYKYFDESLGRLDVTVGKITTEDAGKMNP